MMQDNTVLSLPVIEACNQVRTQLGLNHDQ